jgi:hypothetical protein
VPLVVTVTVNGRAAPLVTERLAGTWQAAPKGAPLQAREILPVKPGPGINCNWYFAVCPAETEAVDDPPGAGPAVTAGLALPPTLMTCGELGASSEKVIVATRGPVVNGANITFMVQVAFVG